MPKYIKFNIKNKDNFVQSFAFYPVKKNANTSAKIFFAKHLNLDHKFYYIDDAIPRYQVYTNQKALKFMFSNQKAGKKNLNHFVANNKPFEKVNVDFKICIVRDPLKRFISAYKNRILYHKDVEFFDLSVDQVLECLEAENFENSHFQKQSYFLGQSLSYYDFVGKVEQVNNFEKEINQIFQKYVEFPRLQTGGKEFYLNLSKSQKSKIFKIYSNDYDLIKFYKKY